MYLEILNKVVEKLRKNGLLNDSTFETLKELDDSERERIEAAIDKHLKADAELNKQFDEEIKVLKEI